MPNTEAELRCDALSIFKKALEAADAGNAVRRHFTRAGSRVTVGSHQIDLSGFELIFLVSVGKAAIPMARAVEEIAGNDLDGALIVTKQGHASDTLRLGQAIHAGHPIPDAAGLAAARKIHRLAESLAARDLLIAAISGGASALVAAPADSVTLGAKQQTTDLLLRAGATIQQLNTVRKHISFLKGGGLAKLAFPATVISLLLSDVIGDPLDVIGSGLTAPDPSTYADALRVLEEFDLLGRVPRSIEAHLLDGVAGRISETPKPGDPVFERVHNVVVGSNRLAIEAAAQEAFRLGYRPLILSSSIEGEAREGALLHAQIVREIVASGKPIPRPACILSGGETTVTVRGTGKGGRNQEFALAAAQSIAGLENVLILSAGTDGSDGPTDAAGAFATGTTIWRAQSLGLNAAEYLARNDSYRFFEALGDLLITGPTGTNVMDVHVMLVA